VPPTPPWISRKERAFGPPPRGWPRPHGRAAASPVRRGASHRGPSPGSAQREAATTLTQGVSLAVSDWPALQDDGVSDRLDKMALAGSWRAEQERVLGPCDEATRSQLEGQLPVHLLVEIEVEAVEGLVRVAEASLFDPALDQPVLTALQLVRDERGQKIHRSQGARLGFHDSSFERRGHARQPQLA